MLDHLIPIAEKDSIRQVAATIFLLEPIHQPDRFENYLLEKKLANYQKFEIIKASSIKFRLNKGALEDGAGNAINNGFRFVSFEDGKLLSILKGENLRMLNKEAIYTYHLLKYQGWEKFLETFLTDFTILANEDLPFFSAISLNYLNEFDWNSDTDIPISYIFESDEYFSSKFSKSQNSSFLLNTEEAKEVYKEIEKIEVVVSKKGRKIIVNTQLTYEFSKPNKLIKYYKDGFLKKNFDDIHTKIKNTLKEIFSREVQKKINLI